MQRFATCLQAGDRGAGFDAVFLSAPLALGASLGDPAYESLARKGETMTTAAMVTYAYDQIDQARTELNAVSKVRLGNAAE